MRTITQKVYIAEDGKEFISKEQCLAHEEKIKSDEKNNTYWKIIHQPDLTEGRGHYGLIFAKVKECKHIGVKVMLEDYCYRTFGRPVAFVQGCAAIENWRIFESNREAYVAGGKIKVGDYSYDGERIELALGEKESGLIIIS